MKNLQEELEGMEKSQKKAAEDAKKELARVKKELENMCAANGQEAQAQAQSIKKEGAEGHTALDKKIKDLERELGKLKDRLSMEVEKMVLALQPQMMMSPSRKV